MELRPKKEGKDNFQHDTFQSVNKSFYKMIFLPYIMGDASPE